MAAKTSADPSPTEDSHESLIAEQNEERIEDEEVDVKKTKPKSLPWWMQNLPTPDLGPLRYAGPSDVNRLGLVQYAGFANTSEYRWMYPDHAECPITALNWERRKAVQAIDASRVRKPIRVCLVIEAEHKEDEHILSEVDIPDNEMITGPDVRDGKVVVGFAVWTIPETLMFRRIMRCDSEEECPEIPKDLSRDENNDRVLTLRNLAHDLEEKHRQEGDILLDRLVVHPAYRRAGHGKSLVEWGIRFAQMTNASIFVNAAPDGIPLYENVGFEKIEEYNVDGDELAPEGTSGYIMRFTPENPTA